MNYVNENHILETETEPQMYRNNQKSRDIELGYTRETSRSETCNCPSCTTLCSRVFKHATKSYSYSNSSEDEPERIERKERSDMSED